jgi:hypothetical protein
VIKNLIFLTQSFAEESAEFRREEERGSNMNTGKQQRETQVFVENMAVLIGLDLRDEYKDGVVANFERIQNIAQVVNEFVIPDDVEIAPVFEP